MSFGPARAESQVTHHKDRIRPGKRFAGGEKTPELGIFTFSHSRKGLADTRKLSDA
jgi:hypothetical protein